MPHADLVCRFFGRNEKRTKSDFVLNFVVEKQIVID